MGNRRFGHLENWTQPIWHGFLTDAEIGALESGVPLETVLAGLEITDEVRMLSDEARENFHMNKAVEHGRRSGAPRGMLKNVIAQRVRRWQLEQARQTQ